jgi:hypothetical protein
MGLSAHIIQGSFAPRRGPGSRYRRRGVAIVYGIVAISLLAAISLLVVDYGRAQLVKMELQACVDGAARAGASGIHASVSEARSRARAVGALSKSNGTTVSFTDADFRFGKWNDQTNSIEAAIGSEINAIQVTARRTVPLAFGSFYGKSSVDVAARATSKWTSSSTYAIIGLDWIHMTGNAEVDSYDSASGAYSTGSRRTNGDLGTNGSIELKENVKVYGDATYKQNLVLEDSAKFVPPGTPSKVTTDLAYAPVTLPGSYTTMGNFHGSGNGSLNLTSGNYYFTDLTTSGNFTLNIAGQVNIYVNGNVDITGNAIVQGNKPANLKINVMNGGAVKLAGNGALYTDLYAPTSDVSLHGNGGLFGRILGKTVTSTGNGNIHFDESLAEISPGIISTVK